MGNETSTSKKEETAAQKQTTVKAIAAEAPAAGVRASIVSALTLSTPYVPIFLCVCLPTYLSTYFDINRKYHHYYMQRNKAA